MVSMGVTGALTAASLLVNSVVIVTVFRLTLFVALILDHHPTPAHGYDPTAETVFVPDRFSLLEF